MLLQLQRAVNKIWMQRLQAKFIAKENFLSRKVSKKVSQILEKCRDIGTIIEKCMLTITTVSVQMHGEELES